MTVFVTVSPGLVTLAARADAADGRIVGDLFLGLRPGGSALGRAFEEWAAAGDGPVTIDPPAPEAG